MPRPNPRPPRRRWLRQPLVPYQYILGISVAVGICAYALRRPESRTFRVRGEPPSADALRRALGASAWRESELADGAASLLWTDSHTACQLPRSAARSRLGERVNSIAGLPDLDDPLAFCATMREGGCFSLPADAAALEAALRRLGPPPPWVRAWRAIRAGARRLARPWHPGAAEAASARDASASASASGYLVLSEPNASAEAHSAAPPPRRAWLVRERRDLRLLPPGVGLVAFAPAEAFAARAPRRDGARPRGANRHAQPLLRLPGGAPLVVRVFVLLPGLSPLRAYVHGGALALAPSDWAFRARPAQPAAAAAAAAGAGAGEASGAAPARAEGTNSTDEARAEVAAAFAHAGLLGCESGSGGGNGRKQRHGQAHRLCLPPRVAWALHGDSGTFARQAGPTPTRALGGAELLERSALAAVTSLELRGLGLGSLAGSGGPAHAALKRAAARAAVQLWREALASPATAGGPRAAAAGRLSPEFQLLSLDLALRADGAQAYALAGSLDPLFPRGGGQLVARAEEAFVGDALNLTGAALHPTQRATRLELSRSLHRSLAVRRPPARQQAHAAQGQRGRDTRMRRGPRDEQAALRYAPAGLPPHPLAGCNFALPARRRRAGDTAQPASLAQLEGGPCLQADEVAALAQLETEHNWRHGFQRVDVAEAMAALDAQGDALPRGRMDALLAEYSAHRSWD